MAQAYLDKLSYVPGERLKITFSLGSEELPTYPVTNISTNIFRIEVARNQLLIGFGAAPERSGNNFSVEVTVPINAVPGLYILGHAVITPPDETGSKPQRIQFEPLFFEIRASTDPTSTSKELQVRLKAISENRRIFSEKVHLTANASGNALNDCAFRVLIFAVGTLVHSPQQLEGYRVVPLQGGMSHQQLLSLTNSYISSVGLPSIPFSNETERRFVSGSPSIVVDYHHVQARDHEDAFTYCRELADLIFLALGRNRGQAPREFAGVAYNHSTGNSWHFFHAPWYKGNHISNFSPTAVADSIETILPKLRSNPFLKLISRSYVEAKSEDTDDIRLLRLWTILELAANRHVARNNTPLQNPDGTPILKASGMPETNESQVGRVYSYLLSIGPLTSVSSYTDAAGTHTIIEAGDASNPNYKPGVQVYSLWEMVKAAYAIRNFVAHEGRFDPAIAAKGDQHQQLASASARTGRPTIIRFVERAAERVLLREA